MNRCGSDSAISVRLSMDLGGSLPSRSRSYSALRPMLKARARRGCDEWGGGRRVISSGVDIELASELESGCGRTRRKCVGCKVRIGPRHGVGAFLGCSARSSQGRPDYYRSRKGGIASPTLRHYHAASQKSRLVAVINVNNLLGTAALRTRSASRRCPGRCSRRMSSSAPPALERVGCELAGA